MLLVVSQLHTGHRTRLGRGTQARELGPFSISPSHIVCVCHCITAVVENRGSVDVALPCVKSNDITLDLMRWPNMNVTNVCDGVIAQLIVHFHSMCFDISRAKVSSNRKTTHQTRWDCAYAMCANNKSFSRCRLTQCDRALYHNPTYSALVRKYVHLARLRRAEYAHETNWKRLKLKKNQQKTFIAHINVRLSRHRYVKARRNWVFCWPKCAMRK